MEPIYRQEFDITDLYTDCCGHLKPSAILFLVQEAAGGQCTQMGLGWDTLAARRMFWAVIRHRVQINRLPRKGETVTVETWPMPTTRVAYPRSVVFYDAAGNVLLRSISLWVLMDLDTRAMILPGRSGVTVNGILRGCELPSPPSLPPAAPRGRADRRVCFTDLDVNGHMNNARYLDWLADLLPSGFHKTHIPVDLTLGYLAEAREGDTLRLQWEAAEDGTIRLEIQRQEGDRSHRVFCAELHYGSCCSVN